jgi:hypothetical protein
LVRIKKSNPPSGALSVTYHIQGMTVWAGSSIIKYCNNLIMKDFKDCCQECQLDNPFMRGGSIIGKFAYTKKTPFVQPFETIDSPWADFIPSSIGKNLKALLKLAKKKGTVEKVIKCIYRRQKR